MSVNYAELQERLKKLDLRQKVFYKDENNEVKEDTIIGMFVSGNGIACYTLSGVTFDADRVGNGIFLKREEAVESAYS